MDDFSKLKPTEHMLLWLADDPYGAMRAEVERKLAEQVPGSRLTAFRVASEPQWLTGARPLDENPEKALLIRTGVAFAVTLEVHAPTGEAFELCGIYSWVGVHLDDLENARQRIWFDLDGSLDTFGAEGELKQRMYFA